MHTFLVFWSWPDGAAWSNVIAMPACGIAAFVAAFIFRDHIGRALKSWFARHFGHGAALDAIHERLDVHADLLDLSTPGGLAEVTARLDGLDERIADLAETVRQVLAARSPVPPAVKAPEGMGSRVPKTRGKP